MIKRNLKVTAMQPERNLKVTANLGTKKLLGIINAKEFFPKYASEVRNWKHKLRGRSGDGEPINFTFHDLRIIYFGLKQFSEDFFIELHAKS